MKPFLSHNDTGIIADAAFGGLLRQLISEQHEELLSSGALRTVPDCDCLPRCVVFKDAVDLFCALFDANALALNQFIQDRTRPADNGPITDNETRS